MIEYSLQHNVSVIALSKLKVYHKKVNLQDFELMYSIALTLQRHTYPLPVIGLTVGTKSAIIFLPVYLICHLCCGQVSILESCGVDSRPELNQYEITVLDSLFFTPYETKKSGVRDTKNGFDFKDKKVAFFSCTKNSNTKGNGLLSKKEFFELFKPVFKGHAEEGLLFSMKMKKKNQRDLMQL